MSHGGNPNPVCRFQVEYGVRKAPDETFAKTRLMMFWEGMRMLLNPANRALKLPPQVSAKPLLLIVRNRCAEFRRSVWVKNNRLHENWTRNASNTWVAGVPTTVPL